MNIFWHVEEKYIPLVRKCNVALRFISVFDKSLYCLLGMFDFHDVDGYGCFQSQTGGRPLHCTDTKMRKIDNLHNQIHLASSKLELKK